MKIDYLVAILLFFPLLIIQTTIVPLIAINGVIPDLIIILLAFYALKMGQLHGTILGFIYGLLFDLITGGLLGSSMLSKTVTGFVIGYFYNENKKDIYLKSFIFFFNCRFKYFNYNFFYRTGNFAWNLYRSV